MDFVAVDFETANSSRASVCQVGLARVEGGRVVDVQSWYVVPPTGLDSFEEHQIRVHGITAAAVQDALSWRESAARLASIIGSLPVVAHNASFDAGVYTEACLHEGLAPLNWAWVDSLTIAGRHIDANRYDLPAVSAALGLPAFGHHDAGADAEATALVVLELGRRVGVSTLHELQDADAAPAQRLAVQLPPKARGPRDASGSGSSVRVKDMPQPNQSADAAHPLYGHRVVITGELKGFTREEAWARVAELGAAPQKGVRKDTTVLVIADATTIDSRYPTHLATEKVRKAARYMAAGQPIVLMTGEEFLATIRKRRPAPLPPARQIPTPPAEPKRAPSSTRPAAPRKQTAPAQQPVPSVAPAKPSTADLEQVVAARRRAWLVFTASAVAGLMLLAWIPGIGPLLTLAAWVWAGWKLRNDLRTITSDPGPGA